MSEIRRVGRHTLVYGIGTVASKLVSFVMLPVYTRFLTKSDYGVLELLSMTIDLIAMVAGVGLAAGVFKHYAEAPTPEEKRRLISTVAIGTLATTGLVALLGAIFSPALTRAVFDTPQPPIYFRLFFVTYFFQALSGVGLLYIRAQERSQLFVLANLAKLVVSLSLAIVFVVYLRMGVLGVLLGTLVTAALTFSAFLVYLVRQVGVQFDLARFKTLARFGAPIVVWTLGSFVLTFSDRYFLQHSHGVDEVGVYALAYKFSFLLSTFAVIPFTDIWEPRRFAIANQPDAGDVYRRMFLYLNLAMFAGAIGMLLFIRDGLTILVGADFVPAYRVVPLLIVTTIVQQWTGYCNLGLFLRDGTRLYAVSAVIAVLAALAGNALLIPTWGMMGAGMATVIAYVVRFVPVYVWAQARYHVDYPWAKVAQLVVLFALCWIIRWSVDSLSMVPSLAVSSLMAVLVGAYLYLRLLDPPAREFVKHHLRRPLAALRTRTA